MATMQQLVLLLVAVAVFAMVSCDRIEEFETEDPLSTANLTSNRMRGSLNNCGTHRTRKSRIGHRIAGGYQAGEGEYPSYVQVLARFGNTVNNCGGTIVSDRLVLSAAHCFEQTGSNSLASVELMTGSIGANSGEKFQARQLCLPSEVKYNRNNYDIAILVLKQAIKFNEFVQPACLPPLDIGPNYQAHVVGFGFTSKWPSYRSPNKLQVLPVRRTSSCPAVVGSNAICFISNDPKHPGDACEGDSGGPVYTTIHERQAVVAVVSAGVNRCSAGISQAGVYMNVFSLNSKINEIVKQCRQL